MRALSIIVTSTFCLVVFAANHSFAQDKKGQQIVNEPNPFTTDLCSLSRDGDGRALCCLRHDLAYWAGGSKDMKAAADDLFRKCLVKSDGYTLARAFWSAVRVFGRPSFHTSFRWGYGWNEPRGYEELSEDDLKNLHEKLPVELKTTFTDQMNLLIATIYEIEVDGTLSCESEQAMINYLKIAKPEFKVFGMCTKP